MSLANAHNDSRHIKSTTAFVVETLILLVALVSSMGVLTQLFSQSIAVSQQSERLCQAVGVAENAAEEFAADPTGVSAGKKVGRGVALTGCDGYKVSCETAQIERSAGTLWCARITVSDNQGKVYPLDTSRYVSEVR